MPVETLRDKWTNTVNAVTIGATSENGGTRASTVTIGGQDTLPFLFKEGKMPNKPVTCLEILDIVPEDWPESLKEPFKDVLGDVAAWAKKCVDEYKAELLCIQLQGTHPDSGNRSPEDAAADIKKILEAVKVPLIIRGSGEAEKDNNVLAKCCEASKGENCLIGSATEDNYKTLTASCMADGHNIVAESPIDINIAKQVNILIHDMGFPFEKIIMDPTTGALGYGMEYTYSIMERARLAALNGDKTVSSPFLAFVGQEVWKTKEAKADESEHPEWGPQDKRGIMWEVTTAISLLQAGTDLVVMRHPQAMAEVKKAIDKLMTQ